MHYISNLELNSGEETWSLWVSGDPHCGSLSVPLYFKANSPV